jgi:hypothetical protein
MSYQEEIPLRSFLKLVFHSLHYCDRGFESHRGHECLLFFLFIDKNSMSHYIVILHALHTFIFSLQ